MKSDLKYGKAKYCILRGAGYPLVTTSYDYPKVSEQKVFEYYAKEQWNGIRVKKGDYLFDDRMFPDFAFEVVKVEPEGTVISWSSVIIIEDSNTEFPTAKLKSSISLDDVIGQDSAKRKLKVLEKFLESPERFGLWTPKNILFFGPSGTGKTMIVKALSLQAKVPLIPVNATYLIGGHVGEGAFKIHRLFDRAADMAPCVVFIDELDAIALDRAYQELRGDVTEIVNALLTEMDGINERSGICFIAATNRIDSLDRSVRSRFEEEIDFNLPDTNDRYEILYRNTKNFPLPLSPRIDLHELAKLTDGFSGRDLVEKLLKTGLHYAIIDDSESVAETHLKATLKSIKTSKHPPKNMFG